MRCSRSVPYQEWADFAEVMSQAEHNCGFTGIERWFSSWLFVEKGGINPYSSADSVVVSTSLSIPPFSISQH